MNTLEKTISMVKTLPEAKQLQLQKIINRWQRKNQPTFPKITTDELRRDLQAAEDSFNRGEGIEMGLALEQIREEYGF